MYLVSLTAYKPHDVVYRRHVYHIERGQVAITASDLATKARWSTWKVKRFFSALVRKDMISIRGDFACCILTIKNYDRYQVGTLLESASAPAPATAPATAPANNSPVLSVEGIPALASARVVVPQTNKTDNNVLRKVQDKDLKNCAEEEKNGAPLFENPNFLLPEEPETKPDKAIQVTISVPYLLASWFYALRNVPVRPIPADMHYFKLLLQFYPESVIKKGIEWRLSSDPDGYWATHITIAAVYRQFGNWMAESSVKAISLRQWIAKNPDMDFERFTDPLARADGFMRAFNEAKRNRLVYFEDADYAMYKKAIRIKTSESKAETQGGKT